MLFCKQATGRLRKTTALEKGKIYLQGYGHKSE